MGPRLPSRRRKTIHRVLALAMALEAFVSIRPAHSEPGDIFTIAAPSITDAPPKASDISVGDAAVSTQTGALNYSYAIKVPPGRGEMVPHLALTYSSQAPIYGGIAAGWSLGGAQLISEDTSRGRITPSGRQYQ